jgi:hypothetical protein
MSKKPVIEKPSTEKPLVKVNTKTFVDTGLVWLVNRFLHLYGFAIAYDMNEETGECSDFYVCRTIFRGFEEPFDSEGYERVARYMKENAAELYTEAEYPIAEDFVHRGSRDALLPR